MSLQRDRLTRCAIFVYVVLYLLSSPSARAQGADQGSPTRRTKVKTGIDVLERRGFDILQGKRVGLVTNPTGVASDLRQTADVLFTAPGVKLVALFAPEHGVRGDLEAGRYVPTYVDSRTGLPVYSLYGQRRKPTPDMLRGLDVLVYDIQDIGVRSYTYISTMGNAMEAAAENGVTFLVLDRPNPLGGNRVEGVMLDPKFKSFVGMFPIPYVYGLTPGELATMVNEEGWLTSGVKCDLKVEPMEGWERSMWWDDTGLEWIPPSPHIPRSSTPMFYVMTGLLGELGTANQGVGYTLPFELVGAPWVDGVWLARYLNSQALQGVEFRPLSYRPFYYDSSGLRYEGVQIHVVNRDRINLTAVQFTILDALYRLFPGKDIFARARADRLDMFDKVNGTNEVRRELMSSKSIDELLRKFDQERAVFMIKREKYLLYE